MYAPTLRRLFQSSISKQTNLKLAVYPQILVKTECGGTAWHIQTIPNWLLNHCIGCRKRNMHIRNSYRMLNLPCKNRRNFKLLEKTNMIRHLSISYCILIPPLVSLALSTMITSCVEVSSPSKLTPQHKPKTYLTLYKQAITSSSRKIWLNPNWVPNGKLIIGSLSNWATWVSNLDT